MVRQPRSLVLVIAAILVCALATLVPIAGTSSASTGPGKTSAAKPAQAAAVAAAALVPPPVRYDSHWLREPRTRSKRSDVVAIPRRVAPPTPAHRRLPLRRVTGTRAVALTFDDGPNPEFTPRILALLRQTKTKATFCLIGAKVRAYPGLARQIVRDGHTLCNHTTRHDLNLRHKSETAIRADMAQTNALIKQATGVTPKLFRAPGGLWSPLVVSVAATLGMKSLHWGVDPQDWRRPPSGQIIASVMNNTRAGSIVLMHDGGGDRSQTEAALKPLLPYLHKRFKLSAL